jgi:hypothetical protein
LSWNKNHLAFGTRRGCVGVFDTNSLSEAPRLFRTFHEGPVNSLNWAATSSAEETTLLFSCGGSNIFIHNLSHPEEYAINLNSLLEGGPSKFPPRTIMQFNEDSSMLAVGNEDGSVDIYKWCEGKLTSIGEVKVDWKPIKLIRWHPHTLEDGDTSEYRNWLAVAHSTPYAARITGNKMIHFRLRVKSLIHLISSI